MAIKPSDLLKQAKPSINLEQAHALEAEIDEYLTKAYEGRTTEEMHKTSICFTSCQKDDISSETLSNVVKRYTSIGWQVNITTHTDNQLDLVFQMPPAQVFRAPNPIDVIGN